MAPTRVVLLPGAMFPAELEYGGLLEALEPDVDVLAKDLDLYADAEPPPGWSFTTEADAVLREADARGWGTFHLVGYSGGATAGLALADRHPERLLSLALLEPPWAGSWDWSPTHTDLWNKYDQLGSLPPEQFLPAFMKLGVKAEAVLPALPMADPPPWMETRPAGINAMLRAFKTQELDRGRLAAFKRPVLFVLGGLSNPDHYQEVADGLAAVFPNYRLEVFEERHHFDTPHQMEPQRLAALLKEHWERAEADAAA